MILFLKKWPVEEKPQDFGNYQVYYSLIIGLGGVGGKGSD